MLSSDELSLKLEKTSINSTFESSIIAHWSLNSSPSFEYWNPSLSFDQISSLLNCLVLNVDKSKLPKLKSSLPKLITLSPYVKIVSPECKPNLLFLILSILYKNKSDTSSEQSLLKSLNSFDIFIPRNRLNAICKEFISEDWEIFASKPYISSPLFIDRIKSYETNPGSIGMLFESNIIDKEYHRSYVSQKVVIGNISIACTGEIDCFDDETILEVKSRPAWAKSNDSRIHDNWVQSKLAGVDYILTGSFNSVGNTNRGPVAFKTSDFERLSLNEYANKVKDKTSAFEYCEDVLCTILKSCKDVGVVYHITGRRGKPCTISKCKNQFAIDQVVVENCVKVIMNIP